MRFTIKVVRGVTELSVSHLDHSKFTDESMREKIASMRKIVSALDDAKADTVAIEMNDYDARIKHSRLTVWNPEPDTINFSPVEIVKSLSESVSKSVIG